MLRRVLLGGMVALLWGCAAPQQALVNPGDSKAMIRDGALGGGRGGAAFFFVSEVDGKNVVKTSLTASRTASFGRGSDLQIEGVERAVPAGRPIRLRLSAQYGYAAPIQAAFNSQASYAVDGEANTTLQAGVRYRVNGVLDAYRREVWLEEESTGKRVSEKIIGAAAPADSSDVAATESYTCCNLRYEGDWISDLNGIGLPFVPAGARITVKDYGRYRAYVLIDGRPMRIGQDYGRKQETKEQYVAKLIVKDDPRQRMASFPPAVQAAIQEGKVIAGMTKDQVIMSLGYPRTDVTPSLADSEWTYWTAEEAEEFTLVWSRDGHLQEIDAERRILRRVVYSR